MAPVRHSAAIYRGPVAPERILADAVRLRLSDAERVQTALPFPGRWYDGRRRYAPLSIVADLLDHNFPTDAAEYCENNLGDLVKQPRFTDVSNVLGATLARDVSVARALDFYRILLSDQPNNLPLLNNVAWTLATHADDNIRNGDEAIHWATRAAELTKRRSPPVLDTLAAAYAEAGDFEQAINVSDEALVIANRAGDNSMLKKMRQRRTACRTAPSFLDSYYRPTEAW